MAGRDTRTRYQGVFARHRKACPVDADGDGCACSPSYYGKVYDRETKRHVSTKRLGTITAARNARRDLADMVEKGTLPRQEAVRLRDARERFVKAAREGRALNKHGRRYKATAIKDVEECLRVHVEPKLGRKRLGDVRRGDVQALVDDLAPKLSGSRIRSIVNALRSLYRWAQDRELVAHDPAALVRLPAMNAKARDRVATPGEFARLVAALALADALPYALAAYGTGRRSEILHLRWRDVDLDVGAIEWGADEQARKSESARRVVPTVRPLTALLKRAFLEQGRPDGAALVCPPLKTSRSGLLNTGSLAKRADEGWTAAKLTPIGLHESRHTAATWLHAAGVPDIVASRLMGHRPKQRDPAAAAITLERYTHVLPGAPERAREQLDAFLAAQVAEEAKSTGATT